MDDEALALFTLIARGAEDFKARADRWTDAAVEQALETVKSVTSVTSVGSDVATADFVRTAEALVSPAADAHRATLRALAVQRAAVGPQTVSLYSPLYLSNACTNRCVYCGFRHDNDIARLTLTDAAIEREATMLAKSGVQEVLLLTGEAPAQVGVDYVIRAIEITRSRFRTIGLEVFPMSVSEYARVCQAGASVLTLYQETYDPRVYRQVHQAGRKRNFQHRLSAPHRAVEAGFRSIGIGALLGLGDWRFETLALALHARFLQALAPDLQVSISFPRIRSAEGAVSARRAVDDDALIHMMSALRVLLPGVTLVLSTRETAELRDALSGTLATKLSAGSKTNPGGYSTEATDGRGEQFEVHDHRPASVVAASLVQRGFGVRGYVENMGGTRALGTRLTFVG
ncbi:MAG: radical SAM protein [Deltaproteobacteria bacterium]|nr:radical SAM protein [Deltaproteobacteria bacterium]